VLLTFVLIVAAFWLLHRPTVVRHVVAPYTSFVTGVSRAALELLGVPAQNQGAVISAPGFSVTIRSVCNGLEVTAIFIAGVLAFPAGWRGKLVGLVIGYAAIFLVNIVRIVVLFLLGLHMPNVFESAHYYYAQGFVVLVTAVIWVVWVLACTRRAPASDTRAAA
jgi:exosortase H (IPTLxxWG-CTERM-specific)